LGNGRIPGFTATAQIFFRRLLRIAGIFIKSGYNIKNPRLQPMNAGICKIKLHLPDNNSLKGKRRIIKSIISRLRNQYNISIAEVEDQDLWQVATIGISCVSNSHGHVGDTISAILSFIRDNYPEVEVVDHDTEVMQGF